MIGALGRAEDASVDLRFGLRGPSVPPDVMVVAIDDATFSDLGVRWPFPRSLHAKAIDRLRAAGARAIVYDVQFTEQTEPRQDLALYDAVARAGHVVLATTEIGDGGATNVLGGDENLRSARAWAAAANLPTSPGGVIRRVQESIAGLDTIAVRTAENLSGRRPDPSLFAGGGALIDYRGPPGSVPAVSFSDLVSGRVDPGLIRGKVVVIGASAPSLQDVHATPTATHTSMSGPEIQANAIWTAMHGFPLRDGPPWAGLLALAVLAFAAPVAGLRLDARVAAGSAVLLGAAYAAGTVIAFDTGTVLSLVPPIAACAVGVVSSLAASYWMESRERRRVTGENEVLEDMVRARTAQLRETQLEIVRRLAQAAESRDEDTGLHIERMSRMCESLGRAVGMSETETEELRHASVLHDVGKIGIPDEILLKPGRLDDEEMEIMRRHTSIGASILAGSSSPLIQLAETIALTHHERWDGTGYPAGLAGEQIPRPGRIAAVCDVFDALLAKRPYKESWPLEKALAEMESLSGTHFDPTLIRAFLAIAPDLAPMMDAVSEEELALGEAAGGLAATRAPAGV
jgi:CHASE2 domain-containing sensor protein